MVAITFDVDWAADFVIEDTLALLGEAGVRATIFSTHATPLLVNTKHEIGIHPNFVGAKEYSHELYRLMSLYPGAKGVRCHSYYEHFDLLNLFKAYGLTYDSNILMFGCRNIHPFRHWNGLHRFPIFWADGVNCCAKGDWKPPAISKSLQVYNFHPIHVFLNTETLARYDAARPFDHDPANLREFVNGGIGTRTFLKRLLEYTRCTPQTLGEMAMQS